MTFFRFDQNNSYGRYEHDVAAGIGAVVIIEALDRVHANSRAKEIGLYFDGNGDCPCCGNRWSPIWDYDDGEESITGHGITDSHKYVTKNYHLEDSRQDGVYGYVHYLSGLIAPIDYVHTGE